MAEMPRNGERVEIRRWDPLTERTRWISGRVESFGQVVITHLDLGAPIKRFRGTPIENSIWRFTAKAEQG